MGNGPQPVRITVLKKLDTGEIREKYGDNVEAVCPLWEEGREFMVKDMAMPADFCSWAWADIQRDVAHLALGGDFFWMKRKGTTISCCTDGLRPVIFKLERIEE